MTDTSKHLNKLSEIDHDQLIDDSSLNYQKYFINQWFDALLSIDVDDFTAVYEVKNALLSLGKKEQNALWQHNDALKQPLQRLMNDKHSGQKINDLLANLQQQIAKLRPPENNKGGLKTMFLLLFSSKQTAWQLWLENYHQLKKHIKVSTKTLEAEKKQLLIFTTMLMDKKHKLIQYLTELENALDMINLMTEKLAKQRDREENQGIIGIIKNEFLPTLQKKNVELQQQLLIGRQTVMTIDLIAQQHNTQANSIDQALYTTSSALDVAAGLVLAEQGEKSLNQFDKKSSNTMKSRAANTQQLIIVQQRIEHALKEIDGTRKKYIESTLDTES